MYSFALVENSGWSSSSLPRSTSYIEVTRSFLPKIQTPGACDRRFEDGLERTVYGETAPMSHTWVVTVPTRIQMSITYLSLASALALSHRYFIPAKDVSMYRRRLTLLRNHFDSKVCRYSLGSHWPVTSSYVTLYNWSDDRKLGEDTRLRLWFPLIDDEYWNELYCRWPTLRPDLYTVAKTIKNVEALERHHQYD